MAPPPFLARPYPLDEYLDQLDRDYERVTVRLLRRAQWVPGEVDGIALDAGEALIDERSERLWGALRLDRDVSAAGRRALVRRVLERLERDGWISRRAARANGPKNGPTNSPRNGPSPTVVRFLKFREILWPAAVAAAQETAQGSPQEKAQASGPILPVLPPEPPAPPAGRPARARLGPLAADLVANVTAGLGSSLSPLVVQSDADELEAVISEHFGGVDGALEHLAKTCRERSEPGRPYVIRSQVLVLDMLRDARPPALSAPGSTRGGAASGGLR